MGALKLATPGGKAVFFQPDGRISSDEAGGDKLGAWLTANEKKENAIFYKLDPAAQSTDNPDGWSRVFIAWNFTECNQLAGEIHGEKCIFDGFIRIGDGLDLEYAVIAPGNTSQPFTAINTLHVYGRPSLDRNDDLVIDLNGGGRMKVIGGDLDLPAGPSNPKFFMRQEGARTVLCYTAKTKNSNGTSIGAQIRPRGAVDVDEGRLVFNAKVSGSDYQLKFQGDLRGTTVGLTYDSKCGFKFELAGKWQFNNFTNAVTLALTRVGSRQFKAQLSGKMVGKQGAGTNLVTLSYEILLDGNATNRLSVMLEGKYEIDTRGFLQFKIQAGESYRFEIGGEYRALDGQLAFAFNAVVTPQGPAFSIGLDLDLRDFKLKVNTSLPPGSQITTEVTFTIRQVFKQDIWRLERAA